MSKQKSQIGEHLDPRADSYFSYDKKEQCWVIATTWHVFLHKVGDPDEHYETRHFRAARRFDTEPTDADFAEFANVSKKGLDDFMAAGYWSGDEKDGEQVEPWQFDRAFVKDLRGER